MTKIKTGDNVSIHYTGTLEDGSVFDSSEGREPLEFEVGSGHIIVGLDEEMPGMEVGEKKIVNIPCELAYGEAVEEMKQAVGVADHKAIIEASGGIGLNNIKEVALTGVDIISVGALTHSYQSLDISLLIG